MSTSTTESKSGTPEGGEQTADSGAPQGDAGPEAQPTRDEAVRKAYSEATTALRLAHRDEFNADVAKRVKAAGHEWTPRPTEEEKREAKVRALLAEDPTLIEKIKGA